MKSSGHGNIKQFILFLQKDDMIYDLMNAQPLESSTKLQKCNLYSIMHSPPPMRRCFDLRFHRCVGCFDHVVFFVAGEFSRAMKVRFFSPDAYLDEALGQRRQGT